jgi:predicted site-specific integrase-resolvase
MTIGEWCKMHSISRGTYYLLRKEGKAPRTIMCRSRPRITEEANAEWIRAREEEEPKSAVRHSTKYQNTS